MRIVLQRVKQASVRVDDKVVGAIEHGFVALVGVSHEDTRLQAEMLAKKQPTCASSKTTRGK